MKLQKQRSYSARGARNGLFERETYSDYFWCHDNMLWQTSEGQSTSPRPQSRRSKSSREIYHPAIKDLSEQAGLNSQSYCVDEDIQGIPPYYVNGDASVSCSHDIISTNQDLTSTPSEPVRLSTASTFCSTKRLPALYENSYGSYRQRVVMSGIRMKLLNSNRRPRSTEPTGTIAPSIPYNSPSDPNGNVSFIIKNINSQNNESEHNPHERRRVPHYSAKARFKNNSGGTLLSDGKQVHMNVFHQHLVNIHPIERQRTSLWLSNGFKVQSFKSKGNRSQGTVKPNSSEGYFRNFRKSANGKLCREFSNLQVQNNMKAELERRKDLETILHENLKPTGDDEVKICPLQIQGGLTGPNRLASDFNLQKG